MSAVYTPKNGKHRIKKEVFLSIFRSVVKGNVLKQTNKLRGSGSPYLEQHAKNPVHWQIWSKEAFELARKLDKPILVSIGYSTCHWCHVMAHESFENEEIAAVMNTALVSIKVDREQHPAVDSVYMEAAQALSGAGGWPLNVFVNHDGLPFFALTYLPPERWAALIHQLSQIWKEDPARIQQIASSLRKHLDEKILEVEKTPSRLPLALSEALKDVYDHQDPGLKQGTNPMKFPPSQLIDWMLEYGSKNERDMGIAILTAMMDSGLHDRVGGGFHRYSVDGQWRVPHFEKMTYDNAQLMGVYARASCLVDSPALAEDLLAASSGIADWFIKEMQVNAENGEFLGYATATDADDALGEGTYFAWPPEALENVLGKDDAAWLSRRWNISGKGCLPREGKHYQPVSSWIPHPRGSSDYPQTYRPQAYQACHSARERENNLIAKLYLSRQKRPAPSRDEKVLCDQNALLLEGFIRLSRYGGNRRYNEAARELADLLLQKARLGRSEGLKRSAGIDACISDYGYLSMALCGAFSLFGDSEFVNAAEWVANEAVNKLSNGRGSYFSVSEDDAALYKRPVEDFDGPSPAGQHALGISFLRLYNISGDAIWKTRARELLEARGSIGRMAPTGAPSLIRLASFYETPHSLVLTGSQNDPQTTELLGILRRMSGPDSMIIPADQVAAQGVKWPAVHGRVGLQKPEVLICQESRCLLPASNETEIIQRLGQLGSSQ